MEQKVTDPDEKDDPGTDPDPKDDPNTGSSDTEVDTSLTDDSESGEPPKWHHSLPKPLIGHEALLGYSTIGEAAQALIDQTGRAQETVEIPGEDATPEAEHEFYSKLGRPEGPEGYELSKPKDWPEGAPWDEALSKSFAEQAHQAGLTKKQAQRLFTESCADAAKTWNGSLEVRTKQRADWNKQLLDAAGGDEKELAVMMEQAKQASRLVGPPELDKLFEQLGIDRHPLVIQRNLRMYKAVGDDKAFFPQRAAQVEMDEERAKTDRFYNHVDKD